MRAHASVGWAPLPTLIVSWAALAQVLSFRGVVIWAGGCSLLVLLAMRALLLARRPVPAMLAGVVLTLAFAYLADAYGGSTSGPLARATLLACGLTAAATAIAFTRYPLLLLAPSLALLGSGLALGAAGSAGVWVGLWSVAAAVTAALLGPYRKRDLAAPARLVPFALLIAGAGLVAVAALVIASPLLSTPWTIPGAGANRSGDSVPAAAAEQPPPPADSAAEAPAQAVAPAESIVPTVIQWALIALLVVLAVLLTWLLARRIFAWIRWRSLRRRLSRGTPEQRVIGAWTYLRLRRDARGNPLPASASPDVAAEWAVTTGDSALATVARLAARVAFNPEGTMSMPDSALAWEQALSSDRLDRRKPR
jgi:hypothetical protein